MFDAPPRIGDALIGQIVDVQVTDASPLTLFGRLKA